MNSSLKFSFKDSFKKIYKDCFKTIQKQILRKFFRKLPQKIMRDHWGICFGNLSGESSKSSLANLQKSFYFKNKTFKKFNSTTTTQEFTIPEVNSSEVCSSFQGISQGNPSETCSGIPAGISPKIVSRTPSRISFRNMSRCSSKDSFYFSRNSTKKFALNSKERFL